MVSQSEIEWRTRDEAAAILKTQADRRPIAIVDAAPGSGKTYQVERIVHQSVDALGERCIVATYTNAQACDLARRLTQSYPDLRLTLLVGRRFVPPPDLVARPTLSIVSSPTNVPHGCRVVIGNAAKLSYVPSSQHHADLLIVDEAYQVPHFLFEQIGSLGDRICLVGDPGQVDPVIPAEITEWRSDPSGPHVPCPQALRHRFPHAAYRTLSVTRRLTADTAAVVRQCFYPHLSFDALYDHRDRRLQLSRLPGMIIDQPLDALTRGASLVMASLPAAVMGDADEEAADVIAAVILRLLERQAVLVEQGTERRLQPQDIGVVCAHIAQVTAVRQRLPLDGVYVETVERIQGLERAIVVAHHPLAGRQNVDAFHTNPGRMCVMTSRHRIGCLIVARAGIATLLDRNPPVGDHALGCADDGAGYRGWLAHRFLLQTLEEQNRVFTLQGSGR